MNHQEYLDLIDELNEQIQDNKWTENLGLSFSYSTTGYTSVIDFGNFCLYNSENDSLSKYDYIVDNYVDVKLKDFVIKQWNIIKDELFKIDLK